jgi:KaiC/GvpD/RAD55 family RecA-like ATPase
MRQLFNDVKMPLVKTGIAGLDEFLLGGLPPRVLLLVGLPGSGNEIFARQIAFNRAKHVGVTYFTISMRSEFVKEDMAAYGWDITPLEETGAWKFINLKDLNETSEILNEIKQHRSIVIDSLSELLLAHKISCTANLLTAMAIENAEGKECHFVLLTEGMQDKIAETAMEYFAEGVIAFNTTWTTDTTVRNLLIKKFRGAPVPSRGLPYNVGKKGVIVETAIRIT